MPISWPTTYSKLDAGLHQLANAKQKFGSNLKFQINWNVNPGWEWRDERCLDKLYDRYPQAVDFDHGYRFLTDPCYEDANHLRDLVHILCSNATCPENVLMDIDMYYNTGYSLEVLRKNKKVLAELKVPFGINLVDMCNDYPNCVFEETSDGNAMYMNKNASAKYPSYNRNMLQELSQLNMLHFLIKKNIVDEETKIAVASWTSYPVEQGAQVSETIVGSMAHTANQVLNIMSKL
jgi:hypothetical protein